MTINPRANGFNYGIGWGKDQKPAIYMQATLVTQRLGRQAMDASAAAWAVEMRLRALRLAETEKEKADAIVALNDIVYKYDLAVAAE